MSKSFFALAALATLLMANPGLAQASHNSSTSSSEWKPQNPEHNQSALRQLVQEARSSKKN
ncbi:MAG: hypothetical protein Q6L68_13465 [Thermostichus sp. DG02_5_bins_236]